MIWWIRLTFRTAWQTLRGTRGDFKTSDPRAADLTVRWEAQWGGSAPVGWVLRESHHSRWLRFWSLPDGERLPRTEAGRAETERRHLTALTELNTTDAPLMILAEDHGPASYTSGWAKRDLPGAWPWKKFVVIEDDADDDDDHLPFSFWVRAVASDAEVKHVLSRATNDTARFVIAPPDLAWLYAPYDGGADMLIIDDDARLRLRAAHEDWLPNPEYRYGC